MTTRTDSFDASTIGDVVAASRLFERNPVAAPLRVFAMLWIDESFGTGYITDPVLTGEQRFDADVADWNALIENDADIIVALLHVARPAPDGHDAPIVPPSRTLPATIIKRLVGRTVSLTQNSSAFVRLNLESEYSGAQVGHLLSIRDASGSLNDAPAANLNRPKFNDWLESEGLTLDEDTGFFIPEPPVRVTTVTESNFTGERYINAFRAAVDAVVPG